MQQPNSKPGTSFSHEHSTCGPPCLVKSGEAKRSGKRETEYIQEATVTCCWHRPCRESTTPHRHHLLPKHHKRHMRCTLPRFSVQQSRSVQICLNMYVAPPCLCTLFTLHMYTCMHAASNSSHKGAAHHFDVCLYTLILT
jgi:hypothetical protein